MLNTLPTTVIDSGRHIFVDIHYFQLLQYCTKYVNIIPLSISLHFKIKDNQLICYRQALISTIK